jgi:hypothetical protein
MQEAGRVDEFNGGRERKSVLARIAAKPGTDQMQKRPESFAAAVNQVMRDFGNQFDVGGDVPVQMGFDLMHFVFIEGENIR